MARGAIKDPATVDKALAMYQEKAPDGTWAYTVEKIVKLTRLPRATIYYHRDLRQIPKRQEPKQAGDILTMTEVLQALRESEREVGVLRETVERQAAVIEYLAAHVGPNDPAAHEGTEGTSGRSPARPRKRSAHEH